MSPPQREHQQMDFIKIKKLIFKRHCCENKKTSHIGRQYLQNICPTKDLYLERAMKVYVPTKIPECS